MAVILGSVGDNFAAGMTGGMAFIYDKSKEFEKSKYRVGRLAKYRNRLLEEIFKTINFGTFKRDNVNLSKK